MLKPAIGGLLVGLLGLLIPQILSSGYGWAQLAADRGSLMAIPLWIIVVLPLAKIVATSLSIGTGGSGGLFGPGIVIGAFVGAAIWRLGELTGLPGVPDAAGNLRGGRDDDVFRQRRPCAAGHHDHGRGDDRLVLGGARRDPRCRNRIAADVAHQRHHLRGAAANRETAEAERARRRPERQ